MNIRFQNKHKGFANNECVEWTLNIYDEQWFNASLSFPFDVDGSGFVHTIQSANIGPLAKFGVMPSSVEFNIEVNDGDGIIDQWLNDLLPVAQENRFHLEVLKDGDIYWRGTMLMDGISLPVDRCNYSARLMFTDGLGYLQGVENVNVLNLESALYVQWMQGCLLQVPGIQLWQNNEVLFYTYAQWFEANQAINQDPLLDLELLPYGILWDFDEGTGEYVSPSVFEQLNRLCKAFHLRLIQVEGVFHFQQVSQMVRPTLQRYGYSKVPFTGVNLSAFQLLQNETVQHVQKLFEGGKGMPELNYGGVYDFKPALRSVSFDLKTDLNLPLVQRLRRNIPTTGISPFNGRENTLINLGRAVARPNFTLRFSGRIRFKDVRGLLFPTQQGVVYPVNGTNYYRCKLNVFIDGQSFCTFNVDSNGSIGMQTEMDADPVTGQSLQSWFLFLDFDYTHTTAIANTGVITCTITDEVRSASAFGGSPAPGQYICDFADLRMNVNYALTANLSTSDVVRYTADNPQANIKSSQLYEEEVLIGDTYFQGTVIDPNSGQTSLGALRIATTSTLTEKWQANQLGDQLPLTQLLAREVMAMQRVPLRSFRFNMVGVYRVIDRLDFDGRLFIFNQGNFSSYDLSWQITEAVELKKDTQGIINVPTLNVGRESLGAVSITDTGRILPELSGGIGVANEVPQGVVEAIVVTSPGGIGSLPVGGRIIIADTGSASFDSLKVSAPPEDNGNDTFLVPVTGTASITYGPGAEILLTASAEMIQEPPIKLQIFSPQDDNVVVTSIHHHSMVVLDGPENIELSSSAEPGTKVIVFNFPSSFVPIVNTSFMNINPSQLDGRTCYTFVKHSAGWVVVSIV